MTSAATPIRISEEEIANWRSAPDWRFTFACLMADRLPRGKSFVPRLLGRYFFPSMRIATRTAGGALLAVDPGNLDIYTTINSKGSWDPHVVNLCLSILKPGDVFYDIGANAGFISIEVAAHFFDQVKVISFEPQNELARLVALSARLNNFKNIEVYALALGSSAGTINLYIPSHSVHASFKSREEGAKEIACPVIVLDEAVSSGSIPPPTVIKIDVEGAELEALRGAANTIREHPPYIVFEADDNMERFDYGRKDIHSFLCGLAEYTFFYVGTEDTIPAGDDIEDMSFSDILAVPPGGRYENL